MHFVDVETEGEATGEAGKPTATTNEFQLRFINTDMSDSPTILGGYRAWSNIPTTSSDLRSNTLERFEPPTCRSLWLEPRYIRRSEQNDILDSNGPFRSAPKLQLAVQSRHWSANGPAQVLAVCGRGNRVPLQALSPCRFS